MDIDRDAAAVVADRNGAIDMNGDVDIGAKTRPDVRRSNYRALRKRNDADRVRPDRRYTSPAASEPLQDLRVYRSWAASYFWLLSIASRACR